MNSENNFNMKEQIDFSDIKPLIIENIEIKAKRKKRVCCQASSKKSIDQFSEKSMSSSCFN